MRYPEEADIIDAEEMQAIPMTEKHVKKHAALTKDDNLRQHSFEDCCTYCDVHHNKRLSAGKHSLIEAWTSNVNETMSQRTNTTRPASSSTRQKPVGSKYAKYVPPGRPDVDKGFRMISTPLHMRKPTQHSTDTNLGVSTSSRRKGLAGHSDFSESQLQKERSQLAHRVVSLSQHYFQERQNIDKAPRRVKSAHVTKDTTVDTKGGNTIHETEAEDIRGAPMGYHSSPKSLRIEVPSQHEQPRAGGASSTGGQESSNSLHIDIPTASEPQSNVKHVTVELPNDRSNSSRTQLGTRTTSNRLLNMISIDDAFRQHRGTLAMTSPWIGPKIVERDTLHSLSAREEAAKLQVTAQTEHVDKNRVPPQSSLLAISEDYYESKKPANNKEGHVHLESVTANGSHDNNPNGAVLKGFENLEKATEATNNTAYKGLYKFDESCRQPLNLSKGSKRFSRMNKNLHQMVEAFHLHGTPLSRKIQQRQNPQDGESLVTSSSRPQSGSSKASYKYTSTPKFRVGKRGSTHRTSPEENSTTEDGRESFLEMIMDMDQKKSKDVSIHTYLYV